MITAYPPIALATLLVALATPPEDGLIQLLDRDFESLVEKEKDPTRVREAARLLAQIWRAGANPQSHAHSIIVDPDGTVMELPGKSVE